jgi:hypothetical protein
LFLFFGKNVASCPGVENRRVFVFNWEGKTIKTINRVRFLCDWISVNQRDLSWLLNLLGAATLTHSHSHTHTHTHNLLVGETHTHTHNLLGGESHTHTHTHTHAHTHIYIYIYIYTHTHTHTHIYMYISKEFPL